MNPLKQAARHVATTAGPAEPTFQERIYQNGASGATADPLEQAAHVRKSLQDNHLGGTRVVANSQHNRSFLS